MKALVYSNSGMLEDLHIEEIEKPVPKDNEILIKVHAITVMANDFGIGLSNVPETLRSYYPRRPALMVPGQDLAGEVEAFGRKVSQYKKGDKIIAWSGLKLSTCAEYICLPERGTLFKMPVNMSFEEAAALPVGGLDTVYLLRKAQLKRGEKILINGAGGSMGTFAVQYASYCEAEVTAVDSTVKLDLLRSIGADHVIDYTQEDFIQSNKTYDVIFDVIGKNLFSDILNRLNPHGRYVTAVPQLSQILKWLMAARRRDRKVIFWMPRPAFRQTEDYLILQSLIESGYLKVIIDKCFPIEKAAEAYRYVASGQKQGHVIITLTHNQEVYKEK